MEEFKYYSPHAQPQQFHHPLIQPPRAQQQSGSSPLASPSGSSNVTAVAAAAANLRELHKINDDLVRFTMNGGNCENNHLSSTISLLNNLNGNDHLELAFVNSIMTTNSNVALNPNVFAAVAPLERAASVGDKKAGAGRFQAESAGDVAEAKLGNKKANMNTSSPNSVVYSMDRLSPYETNGFVLGGGSDDGRGHPHSHNHHPPINIELVFKGAPANSAGSNPNDSSNLMLMSSAQNDSSATTLLLLNNQQNSDCLKQYGGSNGVQQVSSTNTNSGNRPSSVNSNLTSLSSLDHSAPSSTRHITSSPAASTSPSSSNDTASNYGGSAMNTSILNGTLTPPPDSASSLTNDSMVSSNIYNPYSTKEPMHQMLDCQPQSSKSHQKSQLQQSAGGSNNSQNSHQQMDSGPSLVSLMPISTSSSATTSMLQSVSNGNSLMSLMSPSPGSSSSAVTIGLGKPSNISELSNSSLASSTSDASSSILTPKTAMAVAAAVAAASSGAPKRVRNAKPSNVNDYQRDGKYLERRKRNNVAAKKSRDARKQREDEIAIRASFLEKENSILKAQVQTLKDEAQQLRILLAQKKSTSMGSGMSGSIQSSCSNCANCSALAAAALSKPNLNSNAYLNPNLAQLSGFETTNTGGHSIDLDKQGHHITLTNLTSSQAVANGSLYLPQQHRHPII